MVGERVAAWVLRSSSKRIVKGKRVLYLVTIAFWLVVGCLFLTRGYESTWRLWNIPTVLPPFADARCLTSGSESRALGYDPMFSNPGDPYGRVLNYPRIWHLLFRLGIDQSHTAYLAVTFIALFFAALFFFTDEIDARTAAVMCLIVFSPAVVLGMERGNNDLLVFFVLAAALAAQRKSGILSLLLVIAASILKLFPIAALSCLLRESKRRFLVLASCGCSVLLLYGLLTFNDIEQMRAATPQGASATYGVNAVPLQLERFSGSPSVGRVAGIACSAFAVLVLLLALVASGAESVPAKTKDARYLDAFRVGASIFVFTFMLGANWDYRLMFVVFTVPQLVGWGLGAEQRVSTVARLTLLALAVCCWWLFIYRFLGGHALFGKVLGFMVGDVCSWFALGGLGYLFVRSLPEWAHPSVWRFGWLANRSVG